MTQQNAQSTSEQTLSENDLIAQRHAKLKQIQDTAKETGKVLGRIHLNVSIILLTCKNSLKNRTRHRLKVLKNSM